MSVTSPYQMFKTSADLERQGIKLNYGPFWLYVARAGGSNARFKKVMEAKLKPYRRAIQTDTMAEDLAEKLLREAYAEAIVLGWGSESHGEGQMPGPDGEPMGFTVENVIRLLTDLPELFNDVREQAGKVALFRTIEDGDDAGN